jgi:hypothetical protein
MIASVSCANYKVVVFDFQENHDLMETEDLSPEAKGQQVRADISTEPAFQNNQLQMQQHQQQQKMLKEQKQQQEELLKQQQRELLLEEERLKFNEELRKKREAQEQQRQQLLKQQQQQLDEELLKMKAAQKQQEDDIALKQKQYHEDQQKAAENLKKLQRMEAEIVARAKKFAESVTESQQDIQEGSQEFKFSYRLQSMDDKKMSERENLKFSDSLYNAMASTEIMNEIHFDMEEGIVSCQSIEAEKLILEAAKSAKIKATKTETVNITSLQKQKQKQQQQNEFKLGLFVPDKFKGLRNVKIFFERLMSFNKLSVDEFKITREKTFEAQRNKMPGTQLSIRASSKGYQSLNFNLGLKIPLDKVHTLSFYFTDDSQKKAFYEAKRLAEIAEKAEKSKKRPAAEASSTEEAKRQRVVLTDGEYKIFLKLAESLDERF